jgi:hypothetical protein
VDAADTENNGKAENKLHSNGNTTKRTVNNGQNGQNGQNDCENIMGNSINNQELKSEKKSNTMEMITHEKNQVKSRRESIVSEDNIPDETVDEVCGGMGDDCNEVGSEAGSEVEDLISDYHRRGDRKCSIDSDVDAALQQSLRR